MFLRTNAQRIDEKIARKWSKLTFRAFFSAPRAPQFQGVRSQTFFWGEVQRVLSSPSRECGVRICDYMFTFQRFYFGEKFDSAQKSEGLWPTQRVLPAFATCCVCPRTAFRRRKSRFHREKPKYWSAAYQAVLIFEFWILNCGAPWRTESNRSSRLFSRGKICEGGAGR